MSLDFCRRFHRQSESSCVRGFDDVVFFRGSEIVFYVDDIFECDQDENSKSLILFKLKRFLMRNQDGLQSAAKSTRLAAALKEVRLNDDLC